MNEVKRQIVGNKAKGGACFKKTKLVKFSEKRIFLSPSYARVHVRGKKCLFFVKFDVLSFLEKPLFLRFALLPYYRRNNIEKKLKERTPENYDLLH